MSARFKGDAFDKARKAASALPDVTEGISWGVRAFIVHGTMFACIATNKQAERAVTRRQCGKCGRSSPYVHVPNRAARPTAT